MGRPIGKHLGVNYYVEPRLEADSSPLGRRFSGRLNRSCESVEASLARKESAFLAYPAECDLPALCEARHACTLAQRRAQRVRTAQLALDSPNAAALRITSAR